MDKGMVLLLLGRRDGVHQWGLRCVETVLRYHPGIGRQGAEIIVELIQLGYSPESVAKMVSAILHDAKSP